MEPAKLESTLESFLFDDVDDDASALNDAADDNDDDDDCRAQVQCPRGTLASIFSFFGTNFWPLSNFFQAELFRFLF